MSLCFRQIHCNILTDLSHCCSIPLTLHFSINLQLTRFGQYDDLARKAASSTNRKNRTIKRQSIIFNFNNRGSFRLVRVTFNFALYSDNVIQVLKHSPIPSKKWFHNDLKEESISTKDYKSKYTNLYDLLKDYNNLDVKPGVEATKKLGSFFRSLNLDMHKDGISIPGLTLKYLWNTKDKDCEFQLFKGNEDLYRNYRDNLTTKQEI